MSRGKQQFLIFLLGFVSAAVLMAGGYIIYEKLVDDGRLAGTLIPSQAQDAAGKAKVLVAIQRIEKGDELKPEFFELRERDPGDIPDNSIIDVNMVTGQRAATPIDAKEELTESKLMPGQSPYNSDDRLKDYALQGCLVADTVKPGDWIDIEMVRSNGDTFIVLAKKQVVSLTNNKAIIRVSTAERSLINHAIAEQSAGMGHIEAILYIDDKQPASEVTYMPLKTAAGAQPSEEPEKLESRALQTQVPQMREPQSRMLQTPTDQTQADQTAAVRTATP